MKPGARMIIVKVAEGSYYGQVGSRNWEVPRVENREATHKLVGGYCDGSTGRGPWAK